MGNAEDIAASQRGDLEAFNRLVERYQRAVYNLALRMLGKAADAEDATQETFLSAWRGIKGFRGGPFPPWLFRIAANTCYSFLRRRRPASLEELELAERLPSPQAGPEEEALRREEERAVHKGLASLPPDQRLIILLVDIQGLSYEEAARAAGVSLGTAKSRLHRARLRLRDLLREKGLV